MTEQGSGLLLLNLIARLSSVSWQPSMLNYQETSNKPAAFTVGSDCRELARELQLDDDTTERRPPKEIGPNQFSQSIF